VSVFRYLADFLYHRYREGVRLLSLFLYPLNAILGEGRSVAGLSDFLLGLLVFCNFAELLRKLPYVGNNNPMKSIQNRWNLTRETAALAAAVLIGSVSPHCGWGQSEAKPPVPVGRELYKTCAPCHGAAAEGNYALRAPGLAGQPAWHIERAIQAFRSGIRGSHFDDAEGMLMRPFARIIAAEEDVKRIASYIASLPRVQHPPSAAGDVQSGRRLYGACSVCHGESGEGEEDLGVPPLSGFQDWYLVSQLKKFESGVRGSKPGDDRGTLMRKWVGILPNPEAMRDVAAYIRTLQ
jgi:cytochrome c553